MELNLKVPKGLENRLRSKQSQLVEILELGLAALENHPPTPEELLAYSRRELDDDERTALTERLALDPEAVDELLDLEHFEDLEPPSGGQRLSDEDVHQALAAFRARLEKDAVQPEGESQDASAPRSPEETEAEASPAEAENGGVPFPTTTSGGVEARPVRRTLTTWLALAAGLLLVVGLWSRDSSSDPVASHVHQVSIQRSRSPTDAVRIPAEARLVTLRFDPQRLAEPQGLLRIVSEDRGVVLEKEIESVGPGHNALLVDLDADLLQPGRFHAEFLDLAGENTLASGLPFTVARPEGNPETAP